MLMSKGKNIIIGVIAGLVILGAGYTMITPKKDKTVDNIESQETATSTPIKGSGENGDLVISLSDISEKPKFYSYNELGNAMELIAVKASDGTVRTAFNTCQVCYSSGRGYYKEENGSLVCQNCGNAFSMDDVEAKKGGCNPIPITDEAKKVSEESVTISKEFLKESQEIFSNWKL